MHNFHFSDINIIAIVKVCLASQLLAIVFPIFIQKISFKSDVMFVDKQCLQLYYLADVSHDVLIVKEDLIVG